MALKLFGRNYRLTLNTTDITGLDCEFNVKKSLKPEPNQAKITVYNLSEKTREALNTSDPIEVRLEAGYGDALSQIYLGEVRYAYSSVKGPNIETVISTGDSEKEIQKNRIRVPFGAKTDPGFALTTIGKAIGVDPGNLAKAAAELSSSGLALFPVATVASGNAAQVMTDLCKSANLEWSIQDGKLQILNIGLGLNSKPLIISPNSGLIESPTIDNEKLVNATVLMIPGIRPGIRVAFDTFAIKGLYYITNCEYVGQTAGKDWTIKITCKVVKE